MRCETKQGVKVCDAVGKVWMKSMSDRREDDGWRDVEEGDSEEKAHPRSISRILPDGLPSVVLSKIDDCDEVSLSAIQLMLRSPTFRLIILLYFSLLNIGFVVLLLRKR